MLAKIKIESEKIVVFEFGSLCGLREKVLVNRVSYDSSKSDTPLYRPGHFSVSFTGIQIDHGHGKEIFSSSCTSQFWGIILDVNSSNSYETFHFRFMLTWEPAQSSCEFPPGCTMSEHGFLKPNPVLFDLERLKPRAQLGHELGQGAPCGQCGHKCSGFELHFWKKVCQNCRCGKIEHGVLDREDPGQFFVGKIFDRYAYCIIVWLLYNLINIALLSDPWELEKKSIPLSMETFSRRLVTSVIMTKRRPNGQRADWTKRLFQSFYKIEWMTC